jgi:heme exporter protein CcmB
VTRPHILGTALLVLKKDLAIEMKSREILYTTLLFGVSCVMVFSIAFVREGQPIAGAPAGILWVAIAFAGTLALGRTFERERYGETLRALLLAPSSRAAIYVGKLLGMMVLMAAAELLIVPAIALLFQARFFAQPVLLLGLLVLGTLGFASVGTLFAAMLVRVRTRDVMLPILLYPITIPVMIAGVLGTAALLESPVNEPVATMWIAVLFAVDVVFLTLALWTFDPLMTE